MAKRSPLARVMSALRELALSYPETKEEFPWGHPAIKVKGKIFLSLYLMNDVLNLSVKLPVSSAAALSLPFTRPTEYGLGKSGWVSARFDREDEVPVEMLAEWVEESFRAVAPKRVLAQLEGTEAGESPAPEKKRKKKRTSG
jgi:predicted DNA-binding protein (MmcQ/YjbR family)